jgi:hypothetical protein
MITLAKHDQMLGGEATILMTVTTLVGYPSTDGRRPRGLSPHIRSAVRPGR